MISGGETISAGGVAISDQYLVPTFFAACGPSNEHLLQDTIQSFRDFMSLPRNQLLAKALAATGNATTPISNLFRRFLVDGGNCPANSYETDIRITTNNILLTENVNERYDLWRSFVEEYERQTAPLLSEFEDLTDETKHSLLLAAQRLELLAEKFKLVQEYVRKIGDPNANLDTDMLISMEIQELEELSHLAGNIIEQIAIENVNIMEHEGQVKDAVRDFQRAWEQFQDPNDYIHSLGLLFSINPTNVNIAAGNLGILPERVKLEDPLGVRNVINEAVLAASALGSRNNPAKLVFEWERRDARTYVLNIKFRDIWIDDSRLWNRMKETIDLQDAWWIERDSITSHTVSVVVKVAKSKSNSGNSGGQSSPVVSGTPAPANSHSSGMAAAPAMLESAISYLRRPAHTATTAEQPVELVYEPPEGQQEIKLPCLFDSIVIGSPQPFQTPPMPPISPYAPSASPPPPMIFSAVLLAG